LGKIADEEMYRTFNMGVGMVLVLAPDMAEQAVRVLPELLTVGTIEEFQSSQTDRQSILINPPML
jgi:phosphoribosylaminoimidazole (AIR) synthetase